MRHKYEQLMLESKKDFLGVGSNMGEGKKEAVVKFKDN